MFERFTDKARRVVVLCQEEARRYNHNQIGTEHLVLAFTHDDTGMGRDILTVFGVDFDHLREKVVTRTGEGMNPVGGHIPFTAAAKRTLELALREALEQGVNYVATEHLLLALLRSGDGIGAEVLAELGIGHEATRTQIAQLTGVRFHSARTILFQAGETIYPTRGTAEAAGEGDVTEVTVELRPGEAFAMAHVGHGAVVSSLHADYAELFEACRNHPGGGLEIVVMTPAPKDVHAFGPNRTKVLLGTTTEWARSLSSQGPSQGGRATHDRLRGSVAGLHRRDTLYR